MIPEINADDEGYVWIRDRTKDLIISGGENVYPAEVEDVLYQHPAVAECAVIGVADPLKGQLPRGFVVLKAGVTDDPEDIGRELVARVREEIGAVAAFRDVTVVGGLPKTRSGKILRKTMREIADGKEPAVPSTIEDPGVLDSLRSTLRHVAPVL